MDPRHAHLSAESSQVAVTYVPADFQKIRVLGEGAFGEVSLYKYNGDDPAIRSLCEDNHVVIKHAHSGEIDINELNIASHLFARLNRYGRVIEDINKATPIKYMLAVPLLDGDANPIGLVCKYVKNNDFKSDEYENAESYVRNIFEATKFYRNLNSRSDIPILLAQLAYFMRAAVNELHEAGVFHADLAWRNIMLNTSTRDEVSGRFLSPSLTLIDFGLSVIIPEGGEVAFVEGTKFPLTTVDLNFLNTRGTVTLATDIYAVKVCIISLIALALGAKESDVISFAQGQTPNDVMLHKLRYTTNDVEALDVYFDNARALINGYAGDINLKELLSKFLECFKPYLTTMPQLNPSTASAQARNALLREQDMKLYLQANGEFMQRFIEYNKAKIKSAADINNLLHDIFKLRQLQFTNEFKATDFYQQMIKINTTGDLKIFIATGKVPDKSSSLPIEDAIDIAPLSPRNKKHERRETDYRPIRASAHTDNNEPAAAAANPGNTRHARQQTDISPFPPPDPDTNVTPVAATSPLSQPMRQETETSPFPPPDPDSNVTPVAATSPLNQPMRQETETSPFPPPDPDSNVTPAAASSPLSQHVRQETEISLFPPPDPGSNASTAVAISPAVPGLPRRGPTLYGSSGSDDVKSDTRADEPAMDSPVNSTNKRDTRESFLRQMRRRASQLFRAALSPKAPADGAQPGPQESATTDRSEPNSPPEKKDKESDGSPKKKDKDPKSPRSRK